MKYAEKDKGKAKTTCFLIGRKSINSDIIDMLADHFQTLGQPTIDYSYNKNFKIKVEPAVEQIFAECVTVSTLSCTDPLLLYDTVRDVCQGFKSGIVRAPDITTCPMEYSLDILSSVTIANTTISKSFSS